MLIWEPFSINYNLPVPWDFCWFLCTRVFCFKGHLQNLNSKPSASCRLTLAHSFLVTWAHHLLPASSYILQLACSSSSTTSEKEQGGREHMPARPGGLLSPIPLRKPVPKQTLCNSVAWSQSLLLLLLLVLNLHPRVYFYIFGLDAGRKKLL